MPRSIDPFRDKRRKTSNGGSPKQAQKKKHAKLMRQKRKTTKTEAKLKEVTHDLNVVENRVERAQSILASLQEAPTVAQQRKLIFNMFLEAGFNPLEQMVQEFENIEDPEKRFNAAEKLMQYFAPKLKSVDVTGAQVQEGLTVNVMDFSKTTQKELKAAAREAAQDAVDHAIDVTPEEEPDYSEFLSDEDLMIQEQAKKADGV